MLKRINIKGLFNKFDYEIELKEEGITILTGPNGYGKTTILKIIHAVATKNLAFFFQLPFTEIILTQESTEIRISKTGLNPLEIRTENGQVEIFHKEDIIPETIRQLLLENSAYRPVSKSHYWVDETGIFYKSESLINQLIETNPEFRAKYCIKQMPDFPDVYFIREQRLIRKVAVNRNWNTSFPLAGKEMVDNISSTIENYANELSRKIADFIKADSIIRQKLDSTFPERLFEETSHVNEEEFWKRYDKIRKKQKTLSRYGLSAIKEDSHPSYRREHANALLVYLNDTEEKLSVFDDILQQLEIFSSILNEKRFAFKQIEISPDFGFKFKTEDGEELPLTALSSGEQQEVILLYELLFRAGPGTLVLIDEPEISLHVAWQKEFINDLFKIVKLRKINVIAATHSPQIIDVHWDLVVDLWDLMADMEEASE